ncbi:MAG: tetratricopeptide repeat protein [Burkholderiales bacterium]
MQASVLSIWFWKNMAVWSRLLKRDAMALEYWQRIAAARPTDAKAQATVGHLQAELGQRDQAIEAVQRSLALDAEQPATWYNLGYLLQEAERHAEAIVAFQRASALDEKLDRAYYGQALSLIKTGQLEQAIPLLRRNIDLQPLSPFGFYQLGHVYHRLQRPERVSEMVKRLAGFEPQVARQLARETSAPLPPDLA